MVTPTVTLLALVVALPALVGAATGRLPLEQALGAFLLAVAFVAAGRSLLRTVTGMGESSPGQEAAQSSTPAPPSSEASAPGEPPTSRSANSSAPKDRRR